MDRFYTPAPTAALMAASFDASDWCSPVVVDVAAGAGSLLRAVDLVVRDARCVATDVNAAIVRQVRRDFPHWVTGTCDFMNPRSVRACRAFVTGQDGFDGVVLNPPYSCRGGRTIRVDVFDWNVRASLAMAFVLRALAMLRVQGQMVALLPASVLTAEKDAAARKVLFSEATIRVVREFGRDHFDGAYASSVVVHITRRAARESPPLESRVMSPGGHGALTLVRGRLAMHASMSETQAVRVVHTTNLRKSTVHELEASRLGPVRLAATAPILLFPRVGLPNVEKVVLYQGQPVVLSDCVFGLRGPVHQLREAYQRIVARWDEFSACYGGSCAPYATVATVLRSLEEVGVHAVPEPRLAARAAATLSGRTRQSPVEYREVS